MFDPDRFVMQTRVELADQMRIEEYSSLENGSSNSSDRGAWGSMPISTCELRMSTEAVDSKVSNTGLSMATFERLIWLKTNPACLKSWTISSCRSTASTQSRSDDLSSSSGSFQTTISFLSMPLCPPCGLKLPKPSLCPWPSMCAFASSNQF